MIVLLKSILKPFSEQKAKMIEFVLVIDNRDSVIDIVCFGSDVRRWFDGYRLSSKIQINPLTLLPVSRCHPAIESVLPTKMICDFPFTSESLERPSIHHVLRPFPTQFIFENSISCVSEPRHVLSEQICCSS